MNFERLKSLKASCQPSVSASNCVHALDKSIPTLRTILIVAGVAAAALKIGQTSDYLFAAGLLLHFSIWFEEWWRATRVH